MTLSYPSFSFVLTVLFATALRATPVRIVVIQDKTGSANWTRTPQLAVTDLDALIDLLKVNSGELALGLIRDSSNRGLLRLRIDAPPTPPAKPIPSGRPFADMRAGNAYRAALATFQQDLEKWRTQTDAGILSFQSAAKVLLDQKATAAATDVWGAVVRADRLLCEPVSPGSPQPHLWLVVASDLYHNSNLEKPQKLVSGSRFVVINAGPTASLSPLQSVRFEAIVSALRYLIETENKGK